MTKQSLWKTAAVCFFGIAVSTCVSGNTIFYDDFNDGNAADGKPVAWVPLPTTQGTYDALSGDYLLAPQIDFIGATVRNPILRNVSMRTQLRMLTPSAPGGGVELLARVNSGNLTGYQAGLNQEGRVYITRTGVSCCFADANTDLRPLEEDVIMQFDVIGSSLKLWAWREGEKMPSAPLVTATDSTYILGEVGIDYFSNQPSSALGSAIFRFVHVADMHIPEPSTLCLTYFSLLGPLRKRNRST